MSRLSCFDLGLRSRKESAAIGIGIGTPNADTVAAVIGIANRGSCIKRSRPCLRDIGPSFVAQKAPLRIQVVDTAAFAKALHARDHNEVTLNSVDRMIFPYLSGMGLISALYRAGGFQEERKIKSSFGGPSTYLHLGPRDIR